MNFMDLVVKLGSFALLVISVLVGIMLLISLVDRHARNDSSQNEREKRR